MTTVQHTPGPWEATGNGLIYGQCSADDDEAPFVADVCNDQFHYTDQERANAALIAASPKLLDALERAEFLMRRVWEGDHQALRKLPSAARQARKAITSAKGGRP